MFIAQTCNKVVNKLCYTLLKNRECSVSHTVPDGPVIVPTHRNKLSPSGNAEIPLSPDICHQSQHNMLCIPLNL